MKPVGATQPGHGRHARLETALKARRGRSSHISLCTLPGPAKTMEAVGGRPKKGQSRK